MQRNLNNIFPSDYTNPPTERDLRIEVQDMLRYCQSPSDALVEIAQTDCPYYREALLLTYEKIWLDLLHTRQDFAGYPSGNAWYCYWPQYEADFRDAYHQCEEQQKEIRQPSQPAQAIIQQITTATKQAAQAVVSTIKCQATAAAQTVNIQQITINIEMPVYIVQHGNIGTFVGQADKINLNNQ